MTAVRRLTCAYLVLLAMGLLAPAAASAASAWQMFGHDAQHSRRSPYLGSQAPTLKWATKLVTGSSGWIHSSPALAADGTVYVTADDYHSTYAHLQLFALNPANGAVKWSTDAGDVHGSSPAVGTDGTIYVGGELLSAPMLEQGRLWAFLPTGGPPSWAFTASNAFYSSPAVDGVGTVYIGCDDHNLYALNSGPGHLLWGSPLGGWAGLDSSPALDGRGSVFVGSGAGKMFALQTLSPGTARWAVPTTSGDNVDSSPALSADLGTVYFADDGGTVYALRASDGHTLWAHPGLGKVSPSSEPSSPAIGADGTIFIGGADHNVYALNAADGKTKWTYTTYSPVCSSPAIGKDGTVYVGSDDYNFYALNGSTGKVKWWYHTLAPIKSSPAIGADGTIYFGSEDGRLYAIGGPGSSLSTPRTSGALKHTVAVTYNGTITPQRVARVTLTFQRLKGGKWKAAVKAAVSSKATGVWTFRKKLAAGKYRLQASTAATGAYKAAVSGWKTVTIK
jgi:outer membrane protein assembly factor BamB